MVIGYSKLEFISCLNDYKLTNGYIFMIVKEAMSWKSVKQLFITTFTREAKCVTCYQAIDKAK